MSEYQSAEDAWRIPGEAVTAPAAAPSAGTPVTTTPVAAIAPVATTLAAAPPMPANSVSPLAPVASPSRPPAGSARPPRTSRITADTFLKPSARPPARGWRRVAYQLSGGRLALPPSRAERRRVDRERRARAVVRAGSMTIGVAAGKGGVGKTTVALGTAVAGAMVRHDRLAIIDANPDSGSLAVRSTNVDPAATIIDLLNDAPGIRRQSDVANYLVHHPSRLDVLPTPLDPIATQALGADEYRRSIDVLSQFYSLVYCDLGTALLASSAQYLLREGADQLLIVTAASVDSGTIADFTLEHVAAARGEAWCQRNVVLVINSVRSDALVDPRRLERHFAKRVRAVRRIPWDRHLASGGFFDWDQLGPTTRDAFLELSATVADGIPAAGEN